MSKYLIFGGTTEGRDICHLFAENNIPACVSVATEYGHSSLPAWPTVSVRSGRLAKEAITELIKELGAQMVIDATHPYASLARGNIKAACEGLEVTYLRVRRDHCQVDDALVVDNISEAATLLNERTETALLTTGSKELAMFTQVKDYQSRLFARVLPDPEVVAHCQELGFKGRNLICMQGPFSKDLNVTLMKDLGCFFLVTKDGGSCGGLPEKIQAVREVGGQLILIGRPGDEPGLNLEQALKLLREQFEFDRLI